MATLTQEKLKAYRYDTYALAPEARLHTKEDAVAYVDRRGFASLYPHTGIACPSLWVATAGDRPVAAAHDDPGQITWGWKDELLGERRWYYGKILRKKSTMISLEALPYFYALSENYGSPEDDYLTLYEQGRLSLESKAIYEALLDKGPLHTIELRNETHMSSNESYGRFNKALIELQTDFKILPMGIAHAGAWNYAFIFDITARYYPELEDRAHSISEKAARQKLLEYYLCSVGATTKSEVVKLFGWRPDPVTRTLDSLVASELLAPGVELEGVSGSFYALKGLV